MAVSAFNRNAQTDDGEVATINVTPLVDVLLVLLVIFMVTAPALSGRLDLRLPQPAPDTSTVVPRQVELAIDRSGVYRLDGEATRGADLAPALAELARREPHAVLRIHASPEADFQAFATALAAAQRSGLRDIALP